MMNNILAKAVPSDLGLNLQLPFAWALSLVLASSIQFLFVNLIFGAPAISERPPSPHESLFIGIVLFSIVGPAIETYILVAITSVKVLSKSPIWKSLLIASVAMALHTSAKAESRYLGIIFVLFFAMTYYIATRMSFTSLKICRIECFAIHSVYNLSSMLLAFAAEEGYLL